MSRRERNQMMLELWCIDNSINLEKFKGVFLFTKNSEFIEELGVTVGSTVGSRSAVEMKRRLIKMV